MELGRVVGTVWATKKHPNLDGMKFLIVRNMNPEGTLKRGYTVAVDSVDAGVGEIVLTARGSSARQTARTKDVPSDTVIMAIVDRIDLGGRTHG